MITLRHHVISLVAVFLALAVGVVLGSGPLSDATDRTTSAATPVQDGTAVDARTAFGESFAEAVSPTLVSGRLKDRQVSVVTAPDADEQVITALTDQIAAAGGSLSARYTLSEAMLDPSQKSLVDTLGSQLMTQQPDAVAADASTYDRMGQLLGLAVATGVAEGEPVNRKARAIADAVSGADLMTPLPDVEQKAPLVLFVLGKDADDEGADAIIAGLLAGLSRQAVGVVAVGTTSDGGEGQLGRFRADPAASSVATVDGTDTAAGRTSTILALARAMDTAGGSFGASGADGPAPLG